MLSAFSEHGLFCLLISEHPTTRAEDNSSNCAVRDIMTPRQISMFYYPGKVGPGDGPTCFLPGTQYFALDREGLGQGEERLDPHMLPPKTPAEWHDAISGFTDSRPNSYAETDYRRVAGMELLGLPDLQERPMTISEEDRGMIVMCVPQLILWCCVVQRSCSTLL